MRKRLLFGALALVLLLAGCARPPAASAPATTPATIDPTAIARDFPKVDGSTSTYPLQVLIACEMLGIPWQWGSPLFSREKRIVPKQTSLATPGPARTLMSTEPSGTHESYVNLIGGKTDLILVARAPSEDELKAARAAGVKLDVKPVALDAFVFLVNAKNTVGDLTVEQVRDVYTGKIADWAQLGGTAGPIKAYQRDRNSGSQELMDALVMRGARMINAPDMIVETMMGPINAVGGDPAGIGYSVYYYAAFMLPDEKVKLAGVAGVKPTSDTIRQRAYPLVAEVYVVLRAGTPEDSTATLLRDWLLTPAGQSVVAESGYVPL